MAIRTRGIKLIDFDTEKHEKGAFCWCYPEQFLDKGRTFTWIGNLQHD